MYEFSNFHYQFIVESLVQFFITECEMYELNFFSFIFISWRLITLQYCSGFCHILT